MLETWHCVRVQILSEAYRLHNPRNVTLRGERDSGSRARLFSENPEQDRCGRGVVRNLRESHDGWDVIKFEEDPDDPENGEVDGKSSSLLRVGTMWHSQD